MPTNYPGALDTLTNPTSSDPLSNPSHAAQHANANDAIEALQATLGTNPQGSEATVSDRIAALEGGGGGLTQYVMAGLVPIGGSLTSRLFDGATMAWVAITTTATKTWSLSGALCASCTSGASYAGLSIVAASAQEIDTLDTVDLGAWFDSITLQDAYAKDLYTHTVHSSRVVPPGNYKVYVTASLMDGDTNPRGASASITSFTVTI